MEIDIFAFHDHDHRMQNYVLKCEEGGNDIMCEITEKWLKEGRLEGEEKKLIHQVRCKIIKGKTVDVIADELGSLTPKIPQSLDRLIFLCQIYFYVLRTIVLYGIMYLYIYNT